ncbi:MAG: COG4223 family protein [Rhodospirillales bacterium]
MSEGTPKSGSNIPKSGTGVGGGVGAGADKDKKAAAPAKAPAKSKPKRGLFGRLVLWTVLLAAVAAGGAAATFDYWRPYAEPHIAALLSKLNLQIAGPAQNEQFAALAVRVTALEQVQGAAAQSGSGADETAALKSRVETLEKALDDVRAMTAAAQVSGAGAGEGGEGETPAAVNETFTRINNRIAELERIASDTAKPAELDALAVRLGTLEIQTAEAQAGSEGRGALMVALGDLRAAMAVGAPYKDTLAAVAAVPDAAPADAVAALQICAESGAPTAARLRDDFRAAAREAARLRAAAGDDSGWMSAVAAKASSLVSVRRIGEAAPETLDGRLTAAERALESGDVPTAVRALEGLEGGPGGAVQPWLEAARARMTCGEGLASLGAAAAAWLSGG